MLAWPCKATANGSRIVHSLRNRDQSTGTGAMSEVRHWYRRWVEMRERRYRYLAEILDDIEGFRAEARRQRFGYQLGATAPSSDAGRSQCIGTPSIDAGGDRRRASPHGVCSTEASTSAAVSAASAGDDS
jgi:hypothetical protein